MAMASKTSPLPTLGSDNVSILLGDGTGNFSAPTNFTVGGGPYSVAVGDFNGDGKQDLAVANVRIRQRVDLVGRWRGQFQRPHKLPAGDYLLLSSGGRFQWRWQPRPRRCQHRVSDTVSILLGDGAGNFSAPTNFAVGDDPLLSSGGRFQWRWQARPRRCQLLLRQRVDLVGRWHRQFQRCPQTSLLAIILAQWRWAISMATASKTSPLPTSHRQRVDLVGRWHRQFRRSHKLQRWRCILSQ